MYRPRGQFHGANNFRRDFNARQNHYRGVSYPNSVSYNGAQQGSMEYWCETCDKGFHSPLYLENHKNQHQKCNIDGCQFVAHPKVITKHIQMQHSSGLYKKIAKLADPVEIEKWREERRKKYPTKVNIDKKTAQIKEKIERGEKMGLKRDKFQHKSLEKKSDLKRKQDTFKNRHQNKRPAKNTNANQIANPSKPLIIAKPSKPLLEPEAKFKLQPFAGIQNIIMDSDSSQTESDDESKLDINDEVTADPFIESETIKQDQPLVCGALRNLINEYGSSDDDEDNANELTSLKVKEERTSLKLVTNKSTLVIDKPVSQERKTNKNDSDSGPEEAIIVKKTENSENFAADKPAKKNKKAEPKNIHITKKVNFNRNKPKLPSTLLQKLLQKEVQHERNIILQCIRYIRSKNYFLNVD